MNDEMSKSSEIIAARSKVAAARSSLDEAAALLAGCEIDLSAIGPDTAGIAKALYSQRRLRERFFSPRLFAEPAWDLLLDLYVAQSEGREVSTTSACLAAGVPVTTGLRWIVRLEEAGHVLRVRSDRDIRVTLVKLTSGAFERMTSLILRLSASAPGK